MRLPSIILSSLALCQAWTPSKFATPRLRQIETHLYQSKTKNDYNVVFRPSADHECFDSLKLGTARVHRYSDPDSSVLDDTEYCMWYNARDSELDEDRLPPLSTGRIGRATSRNGLIWKRDEIGSLDTDKKGTSLGLNTESWWGFDTAHLGLGQVLMPMATPSIRSEGGVYLMYYMGGSHEETKISEYLDEEKKGLVPEESVIKGMKMKIGVAISQDGIIWGRVEGGDPSGACMVAYDTADVNQNTVLEIPEELYCGWPEVVVDAAGGEEGKGLYFMYYSTMLKDTKEKAIGYAVSNDGFKWSKKGIILRPSRPLDGAGCARCNVIKKSTLNADGLWEEEGLGWVMFYEGVSVSDGKHRILAAESDDLLSWKKVGNEGLVLDVGQEDDWDAKSVGSPHVIRLNDGFFRMYYTGEGSDGQTAIGVAKSVDLLNWEREQAGVQFSLE